MKTGFGTVEYTGDAREYLDEYLGFDIDAALDKAMTRTEIDEFLDSAASAEECPEDAPLPFTWAQLADEAENWVREESTSRKAA